MTLKALTTGTAGGFEHIRNAPDGICTIRGAFLHFDLLFEPKSFIIGKRQRRVWLWKKRRVRSPSVPVRRST